MNRKLLLQLFALVACLLCSMSAAAAEAYACFTESDHTLTFYYDNVRSSRSGTTYDLNTGESEPDWHYDGTNYYVTQVVFNSSFANFRPSTTRQWFWGMQNLTSISGINYLNTSNVTDMYGMFLECLSLESLDLSTFNTSKVTDMFGMFYSCFSLKSLNLSTFNTSNVTNMDNMFCFCCSLTSLDLSSFNTSKVTYMGKMFYGCQDLTDLDVSNFNTSKVTYMEDMFKDCSNLRTIFAGSGWSTAGVAESTDMFLNCTKLVGGKGTTYDAIHTNKAYAHIDGGTSNPGYFTAAGTEAYACYTPSNTTLTFYYDNLRSSRSGTTYDMNKIWDWPGWRSDGTCSSVTKVVFNSSFAAARPISTCYWFNYMQNLQSITGLSYLNTSEVTDMTYMFAGSKKLTSLDVSNFNTSKVTLMRGMFSGCTGLTSLDVSNFNTSKVTLMRGMFSGCTGLTSLDLSNFNTSRVTDMEYMFNNCTNLRTIYAGDGWSTAAVTSSDGMFTFCTSLVGGKGTTYDANHTNKAYAHIDGGSSNPGYFSTPKEAYACYTPLNTTLTFYYDNQRSFRSGTTYDLNTGSADTGWDSDGTKSDVTKVVFDPSFAAYRPTTTYDWFYLMRNLQSISGISYLNTSEVTNMAHMFNNCTKLTSLDLSGFNTSKVTDMHCMFYKCSTLQTIYVGSGWSTAAVTASSNMFSNCTSLVGGKGTTYDANYIDKTWARIDGGTSRPGYFTDKNAVLRGDVNGDGEVTIADINALINMILSNDSNNVGDVNRDGEVGIADINTLIDIILNN